jgi:hypothetical protein
MINRTNNCDPHNEPECLSGPIVDPWETDFAALVPRFTGGLSAISSALIMYVIMRSQTRLSSIYHRIMFGMSLVDICSSTAMALTSLPMPSYMPKEEIFGYHWAGTRLGNTSTCNAQGFFVWFGISGVFNYNAMLCLYYIFALAFTMKDKDIKKFLEPSMHGFAIVASLAFALPPLFYEMYNPTTSGYAWCGPVPYPNECSFMEDVECIRGNDKMERLMENFQSGFIIGLFAFVILSFVMIIWNVNHTDRIMRKITKNYGAFGHHREMENVLRKHQNITKIVVIQASFYIAAILLTTFPPLALAVGVETVTFKRRPEIMNLRLLVLILNIQSVVRSLCYLILQY